MALEYPKKIETEWKYALVIGLVITLFITGIILSVFPTLNLSITKLLTVLGLYIDIIGVLIASLKTKFYGIFFDGGDIHIKRAKIENNYFQYGMFLIAIGMFLQTASTLLQ